MSILWADGSCDGVAVIEKGVFWIPPPAVISLSSFVGVQMSSDHIEIFCQVQIQVLGSFLWFSESL